MIAPLLVGGADTVSFNGGAEAAAIPRALRPAPDDAVPRSGPTSIVEGGI